MKKLLSILVAVLILVGLVGCAASENTEQSGATTSAQSKETILNPEEAQAAALEHAGLTAEQVTLLHTNYQIDDGISEYEVEFRYEDQKYDYTIHAQTGEILEFEQDLKPTTPTVTEPTESQSAQATETEVTEDPVDSPVVAVPEETPVVTEPTETKLTKEQAQAIALEHAGLKADNVTGLRVEYEVDDGVPEYSVEFRKGDQEYDYTIHAETGKILKHDKEYDPVESPAVAVPEEKPAATESAKSKISKEQAQAIALEHAGLTADQVTGLHVEYEVDDGIPEYSVDFRKGDQDYDYTIHAQTGKILEHDKEYDPVESPAMAVPEEKPAATEPAKSKISKEQAQAIALEHAGLKENQVTRLRVEYEVDDGIPEYSVEFRKDNLEYDYTIHAQTGKILEHEKDIDD